MIQVKFDDIEVVNNTTARRFEAKVGDYLAHIDYVAEDKRIIFIRTKVPQEIEHQGIASKMAHSALEYASAGDLKVIPQCPFVAGYIERHPEYQSLVYDPQS